MLSRRGVTLIELLIVVLILGALAAIAIPRITASAATAKKNACKTNVDVINTQIEMYHADTDDWPVSLTDVTENTSYFPDGEPVCPFGTAYSYSTTTHRISDHNDTDHGL